MNDEVQKLISRFQRRADSKMAPASQSPRYVMRDHLPRPVNQLTIRGNENCIKLWGLIRKNISVILCLILMYNVPIKCQKSNQELALELAMQESDSNFIRNYQMVNHLADLTSSNFQTNDQAQGENKTSDDLIAMQRAEVIERRQDHLPHPSTHQEPQMLQQLRPARLITEYVANQGQKLLKNLVNTTIADLVSQSTVKVAQANKNLVPSGNLLTGQFPTMGKLYTLLFPPNGLQNQQQPTITGSNETMQQDKVQQNQVPPQDNSGSHPRLRKHLQQPHQQTNQLLSLSAPYDSRPRSAISSSGRPHNQDTGHDAQGQEQSSKIHRPVDSGISLSFDPPTDGSFQLEGQIEGLQLDQETTSLNGQDETMGSERQMERHNLQANNQVTAESMSSNSEPETRNHRVPLHEKSPNDGDAHFENQIGNTHLVQDHESLDESASRPIDNNNERRPIETIEYVSTKELEQAPEYQSSIDELGDGQSQVEPSNRTSRLDTVNENSPYVVREPSEYRVITGNKAQSTEDSYLTSQLPSQYDSSVLRLPPDGYYDDYFKPDAVVASQHQHQGQSKIRINHELALDSPLTDYPAKLVTDKSITSEELKKMAQESVMRLSDKNNSLDSYAQPTDKQQVNGTVQVEYSTGAISNDLEIIDKDNGQNSTIGYVTNDKQIGGSSNASVEPLNYNQRKTYDDNPDNNLSRPKSVFVSQQQADNEDSVRLIIADTTNNARDPNNNEKVIRYTSEGLNMTQASHSPRLSFVNKDMNESPLIQPPDQTIELPNQPPDETVALPPSNDHKRQHNEGQQGAKYVELPIETGNKGQANTKARREQKIKLADQHNTKDQDTVGSNDPDEHPPKNLSRGQASHRKKEPVEVARQILSGRSAQPRASNGRIRDIEDASQTNRGRRSNKTSAQRGLNQPRPTGSGKSRERRARQRTAASNKYTRQRTLPRPQVTQVSFDPVELAREQRSKIPPAPGSESPLELVTELPSKLKKLHDNQPDKHELMNELLTALDRVKVAIYKLQPLTAKMNAIYRKSVTSNTRDIVMDNHKGTYAKRYPPGDYDDSYDRMHPSELLNRQPDVPVDRKMKRDLKNPRHPNGSTRVARQYDLDSEAEESMQSAVYSPAPKEVIERHRLEMDAAEKASIQFEPLPSDTGEPQLVATGVGRRLGDGRTIGQLNLTSTAGGVQIFDDDLTEARTPGLRLAKESFDGKDQDRLAYGTELDTKNESSTLSFFRSSDDEASDLDGPLFGYRITIFHSPTSGDDLDANSSSDQFYYHIEKPIDREVSETNDEPTDELPEAESDLSVPNDEEQDAEPMVTSESSLVIIGDGGAKVGGPRIPATSEHLHPLVESLKLDESKHGDSAIMVKKKGEKFKESKEKGGNGDKKTSKSNNESHKKKAHEEKKKKKEFKRIKHNKGVVSKEKKTMHRDKHVKSHDRGAAKEKALKERTQIEFFEREQIVDDEFERGKKSTIKGAWQTGQESKKSLKDLMGDSDTSGGSHYVKHEPRETLDRAASMTSQESIGHGVAAEMASGKKSNKFENKHLEAKGKKFKGWREKGYKIITETEFVDRGSLHDSAYKKRDKGAAHHQKFKKQEARSEGQHGTMTELHKKSHKKEDKKSKKDSEKEKKEHKKVEKKMRKKKKKKTKQPEKKDHEQHESSINRRNMTVTDRPVILGDDEIFLDESDDSQAIDQEPSPSTTRSPTIRPVLSQQPSLMSASSSTFRPAISHSAEKDSTLMKLISGNAHEETLKMPRNLNQYPAALLFSDQVPGELMGKRHNSTTHPGVSIKEPPVQMLGRLQSMNESQTVGSSRSADLKMDNTKSMNATTLLPELTANQSNIRRPSQEDRSLDPLILDIVDNLTGRKVNKTRIGAYVLDDQTQSNKPEQPDKVNHLDSYDGFGSGLSNVRLSEDLAKFLPFLNQAHNSSKGGPHLTLPERSFHMDSRGNLTLRANRASKPTDFELHRSTQSNSTHEYQPSYPWKMDSKQISERTSVASENQNYSNHRNHMSLNHHFPNHSSNFDGQTRSSGPLSMSGVRALPQDHETQGSGALFGHRTKTDGLTRTLPHTHLQNLNVPLNHHSLAGHLTQFVAQSREHIHIPQLPMPNPNLHQRLNPIQGPLPVPFNHQRGPITVDPLFTVPTTMGFGPVIDHHNQALMRPQYIGFENRQSFVSR